MDHIRLHKVVMAGLVFLTCCSGCEGCRNRSGGAAQHVRGRAVIDAFEVWAVEAEMDNDVVSSAYSVVIETFDVTDRIGSDMGAEAQSPSGLLGRLESIDLDASYAAKPLVIRNDLRSVRRIAIAGRASPRPDGNVKKEKTPLELVIRATSDTEGIQFMGRTCELPGTNLIRLPQVANAGNQKAIVAKLVTSSEDGKHYWLHRLVVEVRP